MCFGGTLKTLESKMRAKSRVSRYHWGFIYSGASGEAFVLCGCSERLQGQAGRRHWVFGRHAQWIRQGPRGHGPACAAQMGGGCQAGGSGLFPGRRVGLGPLAQDGKCSLTVASLLWGPVSRAHCVRKSVWSEVGVGPWEGPHGVLGNAKKVSTSQPPKEQT